MYRNYIDYDSYYLDQVGGYIDPYVGPYQRGSGRFTNLARRYGLPVLRYLLKHGKVIGKEALTGLKSGAHQAVQKTLRDFEESFMAPYQGSEGSGLRKKPHLLKKKKKVSKKTKPGKSSKKKDFQIPKRKFIKSKISKKSDIFL